MSKQKEGKLLVDVCNFMRLHHYSIHAERTCCDWIKQYVHFRKIKSRKDLTDGEKKVEAFLTGLTVQKNVAPSTQNQAMNALVCLQNRTGCSLCVGADPHFHLLLLITENAPFMTGHWATTIAGNGEAVNGKRGLEGDVL